MSDATFKKNVDRVREYAQCLATEGRCEVLTSLALALQNELSFNLVDPFSVEDDLPYMELALLFVMDLQGQINRAIVERYGHEKMLSVMMTVVNEINNKERE